MVQFFPVLDGIRKHRKVNRGWRVITASTLIKIEFYHLDPMNIVWHGNYPRFLEQARCVLLDKIGYNYEQMEQSGYAWPIVDMRIKYVRPGVRAQQIKVAATLKEYENRMKIDYLITDAETGERMTRAQTIMVAVRMRDNEMQFASPAAFTDRVEALLCA